MEIKEVQLKLANLELEVSELFKKFYLETGCLIEDIDLQTLDVSNIGSGRIVPLYSIDIKVSL